MAFRDGILVFSQPGALPAAALEQVIQAVRDLDMDRGPRQLARPQAERERRVSYGTSVTLDARSPTRRPGPGGPRRAGVRRAHRDRRHATLRAKLGERDGGLPDPRRLQPAARPPGAAARPRIGLLLPCNVVVRAAPDGTLVEALDPQVMVEVTGQPALAPVAEDAAARMRAALDSLGGRSVEAVGA